MNKLTAADELIRLSVMFGSLTEVATLLRDVGSLEQAAKEAKAAREAETLELEKTKAAVKRAKEDLKKQELALQDQEQSFATSTAKAQEAWELERKAHNDKLQQMQDEANAKLAQFNARLAKTIESEKSMVQVKVDEVRGELEQATASLEAKQAQLLELEAKLDKAKKALNRLGMKFDD